MKKSGSSSTKRIALVHDALVVHAGSEKVALKLTEIFPDAPLFTSAYLPENTFPEFLNRKIITLPFSSMVKSERHFKQLFPIWYLGFNFLDLKNFDLVISSANYLAKFLNPPENCQHICYLHNPFRFLWKRSTYSDQSLPYNAKVNSLISPFLPLLRRIDRSRTRRIDRVVTNSQNVANQIRDTYGLESEVIYPPIPVSEYQISNDIDDYYLYAGRLISHKRVDLVIQACNHLKQKLIIAGDGLERPELEKIAGDTIAFTGKVSDLELKRLYSRCKALLFPSNEDFGMVPVEAQASGRPVIAYRAGGALETVVESETGLFFSDQSAESLCDAICRFQHMDFDPVKIRQFAMRFDESRFEEKILQLVNQY